MLSITTEKRPREKCPLREQLRPPPPLQSEMLPSEPEQLLEIQRGFCIAGLHVVIYTITGHSLKKQPGNSGTRGWGRERERGKGWKWGKNLATPSGRA